MSWECVTSRSAFQKLYLQDITPQVLTGEQAVRVLGLPPLSWDSSVTLQLPSVPVFGTGRQCLLCWSRTEQVIGTCVDYRHSPVGGAGVSSGMPEPASANPNSRPPLGFSTNAAASRKPCPAPLPDTYKLCLHMCYFNSKPA